jgi:hypothetical protein
LIKKLTVIGGGYYPNSTQTYRNDRGDFVRRKINQWGYPDKEHKKEKGDGVYRIGFFGDSYTQAIQVPLGQTFFRLIEDNLKSYNVECLAFGVSGFSTLQSYLTCRKWMDFFDLDMVVYVFCENDLGDQIREIKRAATIPYPILTENGFKIDNSFREGRKYREKFYFKIGDYLTSHSLVCATISQRLKLLLKHGVMIKVTEEDRLMKTKANIITKANKFPNQGDEPSTWPDSLREYAKKLESVILLKWKDEVELKKRKFLIICIPRSLDLKNKDSWKQWLGEFCKNQNIIFIDPTVDLQKMSLSGKEVFYDHFTKYGHTGFANSFVRWFENNALQIMEERKKEKKNVKDVNY